MPSLGNVVSVGRFFLGKVGLIKSVKGGGFATLQDRDWETKLD